MNEERFAKEMKKIQSVISRALQKANTLTALADGGRMSREKLQLCLVIIGICSLFVQIYKKK